MSDTREDVGSAPGEPASAKAPVNCSRKECFREARWKLRVRLWTAHQVHDPATALKIETSLVLCDEHKERPGTVKDFFLKHFRKGIVKQLRAAGKPAPDFDHGEWWFEPL